MADDSDDDDYDIDSSPTNPRPSCSKWSRRKKSCTKAANDEVRTKPAAGALRQCRKASEQSQLNVSMVSDYELREERRFNADRLDCLRARQELGRQRFIPASQSFISLQSMLADQVTFTEEAEPKPEITDPLPCTPVDVVQEILQDFCASPSSAEEDDQLPAFEAPPWFRFRGKQIKTFARKRTKAFAAAGVDDEEEEEDERLSCCSSELSMQEDFTTQVPKTTHCAFDMNSSQKICENLMNLSAFFTQNNANKSINLPDMKLKDCTQMETVECLEEDATDFLEEMGYIISDKEQCKNLDDNCDIKDNAEFSLFNERSRLQDLPIDHLNESDESDANLCGDWFDADFNPQMIAAKESNVTTGAKETNEKAIPATKTSLPAKESSEIDLLEGIPLSEWQPMEISDAVELRNEIVLETHTNAISDYNQLEMIAFSEWQPMELPDAPASNIAAEQTAAGKENLNFDVSENIQFRTASNKTMKLSKDMQRKAAMLLADLEIVATNQPEEQSIDKPLDMFAGFRTASNKTIEVTAQMKKAAQNLMADLETNNSFKEDKPTDCDLLAEIPLSEWQPMDMPDTESKKTMDDADICSQLDIIPLSEWQPMDIPDTSNKEIALSEEHQEEDAKLIAEDTSKKPERIEFRTASNKAMKLSEEMQKKAAMLMADLETLQQQGATTDTDQLDQLKLKPRLPRISTTMEFNTASKEGSDFQSTSAAFNGNHKAAASDDIQFRTASNKVVKLTEEMRKRAAMLMADLEAGTVDQAETTVHLLDKMQSEENSPKQILNPATYRKTAAIIMTDMAAGTVDQAETNVDHLEIQSGECTPKPTPKATTSSKRNKEAEGEKAKSFAIDGITPFEPETKLCLNTATPQQPKLSSANAATPFETPKCTPEMQSSLTELTERSPLDRATKSSIITRRNLLSLNKRRKHKRDAENSSVDAEQTPIRQRFAPIPAASSTPMPERKESAGKDLQCVMRERSCSQDSPRVQRERVGKRKSEDALSPIYAPTNKTRRLGLSRVRNKSSHDI